MSTLSTNQPTNQNLTYSADTVKLQQQQQQQQQQPQQFYDTYKQSYGSEGLQRGGTQFPSVDKQPQLQEQVLKSNWDRQQGSGFQQQLAGSQPLQGQGIAGGSFNRESGVGVINLKPICIEQEPVLYRPQALTIPQPPLMIQPDAIQIPQPPIVIHPEPIVIPQPPLTFQPPAVAVPRPSVTIQPESVVINRHAYSVQPTIQFDLHGCNRFNQPDFKQHVHVKLSGQQALQMQGQQMQGQQLQGQQWVGRSPTVAASQQNLQGQSGMGLGSPSFSGQQNYRLSSGSATNTPQMNTRTF